MKKMILIILGIPLLTFFSVHATYFSDYLPGGKNYLDSNNLYIQNEVINTIDQIKVKPNTDYVIQLPPDTMYYNPYLNIYSPMGTLLEDNPRDSSQCHSEESRLWCSFTTNDSDYLQFTFAAEDLQMYVDYYGYESFQLEEGQVPTDFEWYIEPFVDVNGPEFQGSATFVKAYYEEITIQDIINSHIVVIDDVDGNITENIVVSNDTYSTNMDQAGTYSATLTATDSSGNSSSMILYIVVQDLISPFITGPDTIYVNVDDSLSLSEIINDNYTVSDDHDGYAELQIINDGYTENKDTLGDYTVTLYSEDNNLNTIEKTIHIVVEDIVPPTVLTPVDIDVNISENVTLSDIINSLNVTDNYDSEQTISKVVTLDNYIDNSNTPGTYFIELEISDSSGNEITKTLQIHVIDDVSPIITGPETISVSYINTPSLTDIKNLLSVYDNVDDLSTTDFVIETDSYSTRQEITGEYSITFSLQDSAGNKAYHTITISIYDDQAPTIYIDQYLITVTNETVITPDDALNMMMNNGELSLGEYKIITLNNEYKGNESIPGTYKMSLNFINDSGESFNKDLIVKVVESTNTSESLYTSIRPVFIYTTVLLFTIYIIIKKK
jgi:hypothetical protein